MMYQAQYIFETPRVYKNNVHFLRLFTFIAVSLNSEFLGQYNFIEVKI